MSYEENLKEKIQAALETQHPTAVLEQVMALLERPLQMATPEEEAAIAEGIADIEAGRYYTLEEFIELSRIDDEERKKRFGNT
jgi:predicted transcriptional regulator